MPTINTTSLRQTPRLAIDRASVSEKIVPLRSASVFKKKKIIIPLFILVILILSFGIYQKFFNLSVEDQAAKELKAALVATSKLMILPEDDEPVLATVTDAETLMAEQTFFVGAINSDQLLLFPKNMKAVIYSPSRNKIVNAGPIEQEQKVKNYYNQNQNYENIDQNIDNINTDF